MNFFFILIVSSTHRLLPTSDIIRDIIKAIEEDELGKLKKLLTSHTSPANMIDVTLDKSGNNLWTLAAENGTDDIMNYLLDEISSWPRKDLYRVLHFWTCHRERSCMDIVEKNKQTILEIINQGSRFELLKNHLNANTSDPSKLRTYLQTLKQYLDTSIAHLGKNCTPWQTSSPPKQLKTFLVNLRKELLFNDLEWHHNSLTGIISQSYLPTSKIVQRVIKLEIFCHTQCQWGMFNLVLRRRKKFAGTRKFSP
jgi:hypothetical protein